MGFDKLPPKDQRKGPPTVRQLLEADCPIYVINRCPPQTNIQLSVRNSGDQHGRGKLIPQTAGPYRLDNDLSVDEIKSCIGTLNHYISRRELEVLWPDDVEFGPANEAENVEALKYANWPNQEGYSPPRDLEGLELIEDPAMLEAAAKNPMRTPRVVVLISGLRDGTQKPGRVLRELVSMQQHLTPLDLQHILSNLHHGEEENRIREWAIGRMNYAQHTQRMGGQPATPQQEAAHRAMYASQFPQGAPPPQPEGKIRRTIAVPEAALKPTGRVG